MMSHSMRVSWNLMSVEVPCKENLSTKHLSGCILILVLLMLSIFGYKLFCTPSMTRVSFSVLVNAPGQTGCKLSTPCIISVCTLSVNFCNVTHWVCYGGWGEWQQCMGAWKKLLASKVSCSLHKLTLYELQCWNVVEKCNKPQPFGHKCNVNMF